MPAGVFSARNLRSSTELKPENLSMYVSAEAPSPKFQVPGKFEITIQNRIHYPHRPYRDLEVSDTKGRPDAALRSRRAYAWSFASAVQSGCSNYPTAWYQVAARRSRRMHDLFARKSCSIFRARAHQIRAGRMSSSASRANLLLQARRKRFRSNRSRCP
jgi:hypothetical protein